MTTAAEKPIALVILDGWGISSNTERNAVLQAHTPNYDRICSDYPMTSLLAARNGEEGHLNIGCGRTAHSEDFEIGHAIESGEFATNETLLHGFRHARENGKTVHLIGLLSDGGVHSSTNTLFALLRMARSEGLNDVAVHAILDGVDVPTRTADIYVEALEIKLADIGVGKVASLCGRHFAMDSSGTWERTARVYTMLVHGEGERTNDAVGAIRNSFLRGIADEFVAPVVIEREAGVPVAIVDEGDTVIYFNHRADSTRQLVRSLSIPDAASLGKPLVHSVCLIEYDRAYGLAVAYPSATNANVLTEVLADHGIANFKITERARFPHLTYFFNGAAELQTANDRQSLLSSQLESVPEQYPESESFKIADRFLRDLESSKSGVFVVNLPAAALAAEVGSIAKTIEAVQFIDVCLGGIVAGMRDLGGITLVTASHGICEQVPGQANDESGRDDPLSVLPFHLVADSEVPIRLRERGTLADIAPTILHLLEIDAPSEMTGRTLAVR